MSWLFQLEVKNKGTADVEALSSYLIRLAQVHAVAPGTLLAAVLDRNAERGASCASGTLRTAISALVRPNLTTEATLESLAAGLGSDVCQLEQTTFVALRQALDRPLKAFSPRLRWCPACIREQVAAGDTPYYQLAWQALTVESCRKHHIHLRDRCIQCGGVQDSFRHRSSLAECIRCGGRLDVTTRSDLCDVAQSVEIDSLVRHIAEHPGLRFPAKGVCKVVRTLLDEAWRLDDEHALYRIVPRDECIRFADPSEPITLSSALRIAFRLNVPLPDLLSGKLQGTNRSILRNAGDALPRAIAPTSRRRLATTEVLRERLRQVVSESSHPLALREVARKVGVSVGALRYRFPGESDAIVEAHLAERRRLRADVLARCRASVAQRVHGWNGLEKRPISRKGLLAVLRRSTTLPKNVLREEIARTVLGPVAAGAPSDHRSDV